MGYVHDTQMAQYFAPGVGHYATGTWTDVAGAVTGTIVKKKTATAETSIVTLPVALMANSVAYKGCYLKSVEVYWEVLVAALTTVTAAINKITLPLGNAAAPALEALTFTYDALHDAAAERITLDQHAMTLTITTPEWMSNLSVIYVQMTMVAPATSTIEFLGYRGNFDIRL